MIIPMSRPWQHPDSGIWYFRGRIPADLKDTLVGQPLVLTVGSNANSVRITEILKVSLRTKDPVEARVRHASVQAQLQERWAVARKGPIHLT